MWVLELCPMDHPTLLSSLVGSLEAVTLKSSGIWHRLHAVEANSRDGVLPYA